MALQRRRRAILQALKPQTPPAAPSPTPIRLRGLQIKPTTCRHFSPFTWSCAPHDHVKAIKRWQICSRLYASGQRVGMGLPPASITGVCGGGILPLIQGQIADMSGFMTSYAVILIALAYLLFYALVGCKNVNKDIPVE